MQDVCPRRGSDAALLYQRTWFRNHRPRPVRQKGPDIIFLSQTLRSTINWPCCRWQDAESSNSVNHFAFRVTEFADLKALYDALQPIDGIKVGPMSHGNTLSIYFNDPEGNGLEVFWDTPWHVAQPQGERWDINLSEDQALAWVKPPLDTRRLFKREKTTMLASPRAE